jgi:ethanolamine utilization protein EutA (predicted chaperonin)
VIIRSDSQPALAVNRKIFALAMAVALLVAAAEMPAWASTVASPKSLATDLLTASYAKKAGFTKVSEKVSTTSKTGEKSCPNGAQEAFESASGQMGVFSEAVACTTSKAAAALLNGVQSGTSATSATPPKRLGSSAIERSGGGSTYAIYWQRGKTLELVALNTNVPATSTSTSTTLATPPITPAQQKVLSSLALEQDT